MKNTGFICPICGCEKYDYRGDAEAVGSGCLNKDACSTWTMLYACLGCSVMFGDPKMFSKAGNMEDMPERFILVVAKDLNSAAKWLQKRFPRILRPHMNEMVIGGRVYILCTLLDIFSACHSRDLSEVLADADFNQDELDEIRKHVTPSLSAMDGKLREVHFGRHG